jgi:hypothetical protein
MPFNSGGAQAGAGVGGGLGGLFGGIATLAGVGGKGGDEWYRRALSVIEALSTPDFDMASIAPQDWALVAEYFPEVYEAVIPQGPQMVQDSAEGRAAQLQGVSGLSEIAREGMPLVDRLQADQYQQSLLGAFGAQSEQAQEQAQMRGMSGSYALDQMGDQRAADAAAGYGSDLAIGSANRRLGALSDLGSLGGSLRGQDIQVSGSNADIANRFNEFVAGLQNQAAQYGAGARERAQFGTNQARQGIANRNQQNRQSMQLGDLERQNQLRHLNFQNELARAGLLAEAYSGYGQVKDAQKYAKEQAVAGIGSGIGSIGGGALGGLL